MADREGMDVKCHKCGAEPGEVCRTPKGRIHKYGAHDGRGRQTTDHTALYYTPDQVKDLIAAAIKLERAEASRLADALMELLRDTQHAKHPSCTDGGYCPVRDAREALDAFTNRTEGTGSHVRA